MCSLFMLAKVLSVCFKEDIKNLKKLSTEISKILNNKKAG